MEQYLSNWCQDLESELHNAGRDDNSFYQKRINYCTEFCQILPESGEMIIHNMMRAIAESYFSLGIIDMGEKTYQTLVEKFPTSVWAYIGWGDMYYLWTLNDVIPKNYNKAKSIYEKALTVNKLDDRNEVIDRLKELEKMKNNES